MNGFPVDLGINLFNSVALEKAVTQLSAEVRSMPIEILTERAQPTHKDRELKTRYWKLIQEGVTSNAQYTLGQLHEGICSYTHLYNNFLSNPYKVAWLIKQDKDALSQIEFLQRCCLDHLSGIVALDIRKKNGQPDHANIKLIIKAMNILYALETQK